MTPVFTQELRATNTWSYPVAGAANPEVAIPWRFAGPLNNLNSPVMQLKLDGAGIVAGNSATVEVIWAYQQTGLPGPQETLATKTQVATSVDEANGYMFVLFSPNELSLPTSFTSSWYADSPYPDGSGGDLGVSFHTTMTTPNQGLTSTVNVTTTEYTTGTNANSWVVIWGDCPVTIGGTAVDVANSTIAASGGAITALMNLNSTSAFTGSSGSHHRKVELINAGGTDVFAFGSSVSGQSVNVNNQSTASATFNAFNAGDVFTLKITIGSGTWNSPTDNWRIVRYEEQFTVV